MLDADVHVNGIPQAQAAIPELEDEGLEALARRLESSGSYKVLRRPMPTPFSPEPLKPDEKVGVVLDVETLGLDPLKDEVIELGMVKFAYSESDEVTRILEEFKAFQQPSVPIPPEITELTGISDAMVAGQSIDAALVEAFVADANIVIAHNANFDRRFTTGIKARPTPNNGRFCPIIETRTCVVKKRVEGRSRPVAHRHNSGRFTYPIDLFRRAWIIHDNGKGYVPSAEPEKCSGYFWRASGPEIGTSSRFVASRHGLSMRLNL